MMIIMEDKVYFNCFYVFFKITHIVEIPVLQRYVDATGSRDLKAILASLGYSFLTIIQNEAGIGVF